MSEIVKLTEHSEQKELRDIFFESSTKKEFKDQAEEDVFFWKYAGFYLANNPELAFVAKDEVVRGYCLGTKNSCEVLEIQPHLKMFSDLLTVYPAHFHINCREDSRGRGLGAKLLSCFEQELVRLGSPGVHLITSSDARNRAFYQREGYSFALERVYEGRNLLFMGKKL